MAGGAAALVAGSRQDPELPGRPRSTSNLPAPREAIPSPSLGVAPPLVPPHRPTLSGVGGDPDVPAPREAVPPPNLPAARESIPVPMGLPMNLPAPRGPVPMNLPAPREAVPPPNLPAPRAAVPPPDLPASRAAVPPPNLPVSRQAVMPSAPVSLPAAPGLPLPPGPPASSPWLAVVRDAAPPSDLPAPREAVGLSNLPAPREAVGLANLPASREAPGLANLPAPRSAVPYPNLPAPREAVANPNLPAPRSAVPRASAVPPATPVALARLNLSVERTPAPDLAPANSPLAPLDLNDPGLSFDLSPDEALPAGPGPQQSAFSSAEDPGLDLDLLDDITRAAPLSAAGLAAAFRTPGIPASLGLEAVDGGLGFRLDIEGAEAPSPTSPVAAIVPSSALPAIEVNAMGVLEDALPELAPHREAPLPSTAPKPRTRPKPALLVAAGAGAAALLAGVLLVLVPKLTAGPAPEAVLAPFLPQLESDTFPAYQAAATALVQQAAQESHADGLRAGAAELLLLARLGREAPKALVTEAAQHLSQILPADEPSASERRARALAELAQGKLRGVDALLAGIEDSPGARLIVGLKQLATGNPAAAAGTFEVAASQEPRRLLPPYLGAKALEAAGQAAKAHALYEKVLARNPQHLGAALGALRTAGLPPTELLEKLEKLAGANPGAASGAEVAGVLVLLGKTAAGLGRHHAAPKAFTRALAADPGNAEATIALAESLLAEGRYNDALTRVQSVAGEAVKTAEGLFTWGGALIATHRVTEGLAQVDKAVLKAPQDPRGPFFRAWAAEEAVNPDHKGALAQYQEALSRAPSFVPATLRLASLLQKSQRAPEALKVLKAAEDAGAPPTSLQLAWGQALIVAKQAHRAEDVFRKALAAEPTLAAARLGLASALEAQGRVGEAKLELDELLTQSPDTDGIHERLAGLALRLGEKDEALAHFEAALATGKAGPEVHVALGQLALDMGKLDLAASHLVKVSEESPSTPGALYSLGRLRERQGDLGKALAEYRRATGYENTPEVQLAYGRVLGAAGKEDDALVAFREAFALAEGHLEHGRLLLKRSKADQAIVDFDAAVRIDPEMWEAFLMKGNAHDVLGETDKAAEAWRQVVRLQPKNVEGLYKLGRLEMDRGQIKPALDYLRRAAAGAPQDRPWAADVYFQLGYAELQAGSKKSARDALTKYLALAPTDAPDRPAVEKQLDRLGGF